ncbi:MAG: response regulator [Herpetosiphon sp.]|nr:response regulator [Herpetosiphon sp.]
MDQAQYQRLLNALRASEQRYKALQTEFEHLERRSNFISQIRALLSRETHLPVIYKVAVESLAQTFKYDLVSIYTLNSTILKLQYHVGYDVIHQELPVEKGIIGRVVRSASPAFVANVADDPDFMPAMPDIVSELCVPLLNRDKVVGVINVESRQQGQINEHDLALLSSISDHIVIAMNRAKLYDTVQESEERYRRLVELSPEMQLVHSAYHVVYVNPSTMAFFGTDQANELLGRHISTLITPDYHYLFPIHERELVETGKFKPTEMQLIVLDGSLREVEVAGVMTVYGGKPSVQVVIRNITERKQLEQERILYERKLLEAQKMESLGVLAGGIAHDFNNALMTILGNAAIALLDLDQDSEPYQSVRAIEQSAREASELTKQMLAYSGKGNFLMQAINLNEIMHTMDTLLHSAIPKSVTLKFDLSDTIADIEGDPNQLRQIILNLLTNAGEAIGERNGQILVKTYSQTWTVAPPSVAIAPHLPAGTYVCLEVIDTGIGITSDTLEKIFDPFFSTKFTGRGLGLAVVLGIIRGHGGTIDVRSQPNRGTSIRVFLPTIKKVEKVTQTVPTPSINTHILVVDDEPSVRWVTERVLKRLGFDVLACNDGKSAIETLQQHLNDIACVLLDLTMPIMNGEQTLKALRAIKPNLPIIMMSGYSEETASTHIKRSNLVAFLQKPFTISELQETLSTVVSIPHTVA